MKQKSHNRNILEGDNNLQEAFNSKLSKKGGYKYGFIKGLSGKTHKQEGVYPGQIKIKQ